MAEELNIPKNIHETHQSVLMRDIQTYKQHLQEQKQFLTKIKADILATGKDLVELRKLREADPTNANIQERYKNAAAHLSELQEYLFNDPEAVVVQREIPQMETDLQELNARFLRELQ